MSKVVVEVAEKPLVVPKTPEGVDELIKEYETALLDLETLGTRAGELKLNLIRVVDAAGTAPTNSTVSKRLAGIERSVMVTWGATKSIDTQAVFALEQFLAEKGMSELFERFFALQAAAVYVPPPPKYRQAEDVFKVLMGLPKRLHKKIEDKVAALCTAAIVSKPNSPSVKLEEIKAR